MGNSDQGTSYLRGEDRGHLIGREGVEEVLLVRENEQRHPSELLLLLIDWFQKVNSPRKIFNLLFIIANENIKLTALWGC